MFKKMQEKQYSQLSKLMVNTLECLNIGKPKTINFPFVTNGKLMF